MFCFCYNQLLLTFGKQFFVVLLCFMKICLLQNHRLHFDSKISVHCKTPESSKNSSGDTPCIGNAITTTGH